MQNNDLNVHYFRTETQDLAQNLVDDFFFLTLTEKKKKWKKYECKGLFSEKTEAMHAELNERAEPATRSSFAAVDFWY